MSDTPPDKKHHYGHGKVENFSAFLETILLLITCAWIIYEALHRLISGNTNIEINVWSYIVVVISIVVDVSRSRALYRVAKKYNSQALEADALHFSTDIWSSAVVLIGLICANFGFFFADSVAALVVALIVIVISYRLGKRSMNELLDHAPKDNVAKIEKLISTVSEVHSFKNLGVRSAGADTFVKVTILLDSRLTLGEVHEICDKLERVICKEIDRCDITIHTEPFDL
jgi:cation diffusion facilitator family transporter